MPSHRKNMTQAVQAVTEALKRGDVGVLPTDTIYGIVGSALKKNTVQRIYALRKRDLKKPMIILIGDVRDMKKFGVALDARIVRLLKKVWPGKVSVIMPIGSAWRGIGGTTSRTAPLIKFKYLHRGTRSLAFRLPKPKWLRALLRKTGPLVAPSANFEGATPARTIAEARKYFGDKVSFYIDIGKLNSKPSTLAKIENGQLTVLRKGAAKI
jgi:L-threonylcarbamoyladenylate synthase